MNGKVDVLGTEWLSQGFMKLAKFTVKHDSFAGGTIGPMTREIVVRTSAVAVLPYDPIGDKILLIEQFRLAAHLAGFPAWQRELIAGISDGDRRALLHAARRVVARVRDVELLPDPARLDRSNRAGTIRA